jgi:hypothetical protein
LDIEELILEQLESDGTVKTVRLHRGHEITDLTVALPHEYEEARLGPLHFLDRAAERIFGEKFQAARTRRVPQEKLRRSGGRMSYETTWRGIRTREGCLSLYVLTLPQLAAIDSLSIFDPRKPDTQYSRSLHKDSDTTRYSIYLECRSSYGTFDFDLRVAITTEENAFFAADYTDPKTSVNKYAPPHAYDNVHWQEPRQVVQNFFDGDQYNVKRAGMAGPYGRTGKVTFNAEQHRPPLGGRDER